MLLEIIKDIKIAGKPTKKGDIVEIDDSATEIYIKNGFAIAMQSTGGELTAKEVAELIDKCTSLEELQQYESDERQVVGNAYKKKLKELE